MRVRVRLYGIVHVCTCMSVWYICVCVCMYGTGACSVKDGDNKTSISRGEREWGIQVLLYRLLNLYCIHLHNIIYF